MTPVTIAVGDLDLLAACYAEHLALSVLRAEEDEVVLGRGTEPLLVLRWARPRR